jgi:hypothetical protein
MKKIFNVVMLPTEKVSSIFDKKGKLEYNLNPPLHGIRDLGWKYQHLYITSDDKLKEGDWYYDTNHNVIGIYDSSAQKGLKIVATTDKSLSKGIRSVVKIQLPQIPESFISVYIKSYNDGKAITKVDLDMQEEWDFDKPLGNSQFATKFTIKTNPDNTVIVHSKDEKEYSRDEVSLKLEEFGNFIRDNYYGVGAPKLLSYNTSKYPHANIKQIRDKWIEENLNN